jgi:hypothetical protein
MFFLSMLFASSLFVLNDAVRLEQNVASLPAVFFLWVIFFLSLRLAGELHDVVCLQHHVASIPTVGDLQPL